MRDTHAPDDGLISNSVNIKANYLRGKENRKNERVWVCGALNRSFFFEMSETISVGTRNSHFRRSHIIFWKESELRVYMCVCVWMCARVYVSNQSNSRLKLCINPSYHRESPLKSNRTS